MAHINSQAMQEFYKTTPMREGILNWYPFEKSASVLESSDGALASLLRSRCVDVECFNSEYMGNRKFDYIVIIDPPEITVESLEKYKSLLNVQGRLLLAFENPYGLQYFAGKRNHRTGLPFSFQEGVSKAEVSNRLISAGFKGQKWYYPFPNHYFARDVFSENYLPNEFFNHRGPVMVEDDCTKVFDERELWAEVIRGEAFEFLCDSYLVEVRANGNDEACNVDFAAVTAYRQPGKALITTVHSDGTVRKSAVFEEGMVRLKSTAINHKELKNLGVNILPVEFKDDCLTMKRLELPILWDYWCKKLIEGNLEEKELFRHYDKIYEEIKKSSKEGKSYWELVPANCFYDEVKDEIIFFDQEFCWEGIDPDVVIIRAIGALIFASEFRSYHKTEDWINKLKIRYGLTEKWDELEKIARRGTYEYVFNPAHTEPIFKSAWQAAHHMEELQAQRTSDLSRYKKMTDVAAKIRGMDIGNVAVYGYGLRGKMLRYALTEMDIRITCMIDMQAPIVCGIPLFRAIEEVPPDLIPDLIIVTPLEGAEHIAAEIKSKTHCRVATLKEIMNG